MVSPSVCLAITSKLWSKPYSGPCSVFAAYGAYLYMPQQPNEVDLQVNYHLRRFAWLEQDYEAVAASREDPQGRVDLTK